MTFAIWPILTKNILMIDEAVNINYTYLHDTRDINYILMTHEIANNDKTYCITVKQLTVDPNVYAS